MLRSRLPLLLALAVIGCSGGESASRDDRRDAAASEPGAGAPDADAHDAHEADAGADAPADASVSPADASADVLDATSEGLHVSDAAFEKAPDGGDAADLDAPAGDATGSDAPADGATGDGATADGAPADAAADVSPDAPAGPASPGSYVFDPVATYAALGDPVAAAFHPNGSYALVLSNADKVFRYDPKTNGIATQPVASAGSGVYFRDVVFAPDGARAILLAYAVSGGTPEARLYVWDDEQTTLTEMPNQRYAGGYYRALAWSPDGTSARLLASKPSGGAYLASVWGFDAKSGRDLATFWAQPTSAGCGGLAWSADQLGGPGVVVVCGDNGASHFSIDAGGNVHTDTSNTGNLSSVSGRPQNDYALFMQSSGSPNRIYRFEKGVWSTDYFSPSVYANKVEFSSDGRRALLVGGMRSGGLAAIYEYRDPLYAQADVIDVSTVDLKQPPFSVGSSSPSLNDVAWRPGCDGGIIVGGWSTYQGTGGFVIGYHVANGVACL